MKNTFLLLLTLAASTFGASAEKSLYIPNEWKSYPWNPDTMLYSESDPDNKYTWSKSRSRESENFIVYWDKDYGNTIPTNANSAYSVDIDDLLAKCEGFYALNVGKLAFCEESNSNVSKYKMMILLNHTTTWVCYGGGYDDVIGALWLSPSTSKPVGHSVAHEVGHSFQYQVYADLKGYAGFRTAIGNGSTFWEQTAQWQANQAYPELKWDQSWSLFRGTHNYAMTHEWHRYQSYWWHYYLAERHGIDIIGRLWRYNSGRGVDPNEALSNLLNLNTEDLYREYFLYAMKVATMDFDVTRDEASSYIGTMRYDFVSLGGTKHQVSYSSCPQSSGFNVIRLNVPAAGTTISTDFTSLSNGAALATGDSRQYFDGEKFTAVNTDTYNASANYNKRGFRIGYVALMDDGSRQYLYDDKIYCSSSDANASISERVSCLIPNGVNQLYLVISPAPSEYIQHKWDEEITNDDQWPYTIEFTGTNIFGAADISDRDIEDVEIAYDVYFPVSSTAYVGTTVTLDGTGASAIGTAFQMQASSLSSIFTKWTADGPSDGEAMFYAVNANGEIANEGPSANGYGHWYTKDGNRGTYANGYVYSEFDVNSLTFTLGQYPSKTRIGDTYTIRQAIKYVNGGHQAIATITFHIHITDSRTGSELSSNVSTSIEGAYSEAPQILAVYTAMGTKIKSLQRGINILKMSDGTTRKVIVK